MSIRLEFFTAADAAASSGEKVWLGGEGIFSASASVWGGATVKLQSKAPDKSTWVDVPGLVFSANGFLEFKATNGAGLQAVITGTPTDLYAAADQV